MKTKILFIPLLYALISVKSFSQTEEKRYYYAYNEKIFLHEIENKMIVSVQRNNAADFKTLIRSEKTVWQNDSVYILNVERERQKSLKRDLLQTRGVKSVHPMYAACGTEVGLTDKIVMKFNKNVSHQQIDEIHRKYQVYIDEIADLRYLVTVPNHADALEIANQYQLSGFVEYCHPVFLAKIENHQTIPNDPYFINQFYLHNWGQTMENGRSGTPGADIRAPEAWDITKGSSDIIIAVIDAGVTSDHPDLPISRQVWWNGSNFSVSPPNSDFTPNGNHGNACAGIIAASHNDEGIAGIAPNCKIMPVQVSGGYSNFSGYANAILFAKNNGAHILSCSWGFENYPFSNDPIPTPNLFPDITNAIKDATENGRNGKGCVVVFSAGNFANQAAGDPGFVAFPANVNIPGVLSVGASDRYDQQANYSPTSVLNDPRNQIIDVVAPSSRAGFCTSSIGDLTEGSEVWTIDIPGNAGYNPWFPSGIPNCQYPAFDTQLPASGTNHLAYTGLFSGTSAAAPQVAGVAALMLSVNPNLTQEEVSEFIKSSARKTKGHTYTYQNDPRILHDCRWNPQMGYGVLNAYDAVLRATGAYIFAHHSLIDANTIGHIIECKEVYIHDVEIKGNVGINVTSDQRVVILPPFTADPLGSGAWFQALVELELPCSSSSSSSSGPRSSPPPAIRNTESIATIIKLETRDASLEQNIPNPANEQTLVRYYIPESFRSASLLFTTALGIPVKHIPVYMGGEGEVAVSVSEFSSGVYLYALIVDGRVVATKRMNVVK